MQTHSCHPKPRRPSHLIVGRVLRPWGVKGMLKAQILSDFPGRFLSLREVYVGGKLHCVETNRPHQGMALVKLAGCDTRTQAEQFRGALLEVRVEDAATLPEGEYYIYQLVGLGVWSKNGEYLGQVREVLRTGSNDVYLVHDGDRELLIPAIEDVVLEVDLEGGRVLVELMEDWA